MSRILSVDPNNPDSEAVREIVAVLKAQGTVALPTDTVYGLAVDIFSAAAVERLLTLKGRPSGKPIPIFISSIEALEGVVRGIPGPAERLAQEFWPGPLTLILHASPQIPEGITAGTGTVGVRIPELPLIGAILTALGSCISGTSANRSGGRNPVTVRDVVDEIGQGCDLIVDGGRVGGGVPSTVLDCTHFPFRLLREGAVGREMLATVLGQDPLPT
ncbi:MAG: L-threonylcarbamoyladenylate synthase [Candidatus Methylomirabilales bacterium]